MRAAGNKSKVGSVSVTVELPGEVARRYGSGQKQIARHLLEQAAVEGYRSGELSRGHVGQMLHLDWEETEEFLAKRHCDRHYDLEDLEQDRQSIEKIFGRP